MKELLATIEANNGEIRIMANRYGGGWNCVIALCEQPESFWEKWEDLVCGDNDFFEASEFFKAGGEFIFEWDQTPFLALAKAVTNYKRNETCTLQPAK